MQFKHKISLFLFLFKLYLIRVNYYISTRCLFPNLALIWLSCIKELGIENGIEGSSSSFLLEAEGKKALFYTGLN